MRKCALNNNPACKIPENSLLARPALKCAANNNPSQRGRRSLFAHPIVLSITTLCGKGCPGNCAANNNSCLSPWELLTAGKCALNNNPAGVYA